MPYAFTGRLSDEPIKLKLACLGVVFLLTALILTPGNPENLKLANWLRFPLDVPVIIGVLLLLRGRSFTLANILIVSGILLLSLLRLGDLISRTAFGRAFNPVAEWHLMSQGWTLTSDSLGKFEAIALAATGLFVLVVIAVVLYHGLRLFNYVSTKSRNTLLTVCAIAILGGLALLTFQHPQKDGFRVDWVTGNELLSRYRYTQWTIEDQRQFSELLTQDTIADSNPQFSALSGRDLLILYVESYGRTFIDSSRFEEAAAFRLNSVATEIEAAGLHVKSGWVNSPIRGGRSWLAHGTFASGLPLTNHARFDRLITSDRLSLASLFKNAGWTTATLLPVVKSDWVEGAWYKVDRFFDRDALNYQGKGFGFVTMPDQYTLTAFEERVRSTASKPLMAHIGLLDSHAPWGPLPKILPWEDIGDGSVFDGSQRYGERHGWVGPEPIREAYGMSVDQNLKLIGQYLARFAQDGVFVVLGDHQPASVIDGWAPSAEVPIHIFSSEPAILNRLPGEYFVDGMTPSVSAENMPMESLRALLATAFEEPLELQDLNLTQDENTTPAQYPSNTIQ